MLCALGFSALAGAQSSYIVTTDEESKTEIPDSVQQVIDDAGLGTPEERFLSANFPNLSLCRWYEGMRFMVIPGERDEYLRTFTDSLTGRDVSTGALKHKVLEYRGHETTARGYEHINFRCLDDQKAYYVELRNVAFSDYCEKVANGGVRALAYLGDVDKARELLIDKDMFLRGNIFFRDNKGTPVEVTLKEDTQVKIEKVGVGTRDFPVKIIFRYTDGQLYFQEVTMSRTNCTLLDEDFYREHAKHLFANSFAFNSKSGKKSATMSAKLLGKKINSRQNVTLKNADGKDQRLSKNTIFLVKDIKNDPGTDYYILTLGKEGATYTIRVTFVNKNVAGNIDGNQENYFYELFSEGTEFHGNNSQIVHSRSLTGTGGNFSNMVSGIISKGMTKEQVKFTKGNPDKTWTNKDGTTSWQYFDATYTFRGNKLITISN